MKNSLEQRVAELEKKVAELEGRVPEQPEILKPKLTTLELRAGIFFTGGDFLSEEIKKSLIEEIDTVLEKYTNKNYGMHLIFF